MGAGKGGGKDNKHCPTFFISYATGEYKYFGFVFSCSSSTMTGITNFINQAKRPGSL